MDVKLRHGSLFSGIGGFDLAAAWMGWENVFHCEIDPFCQKVLKHHFPNSKSYENIKTTDFSGFKGQVDIITGGFPCQPFSVAGKRLGTKDERHLWPEMFRAILEARPTWVLAENVRGLLSWSEGMVFEAVCADLEAEEYTVLPFLIPAAGVGAPHRRERIWIVAYAERYDDLGKKRPGMGKEKKMEGADGEKNGSSGQSGRTGKNDLQGTRSRECTSSDPNNQEQEQPECGAETGNGTSGTWNSIGTGTGRTDFRRRITEGIRQLDASAQSLQGTAANTGSIINDLGANVSNPNCRTDKDDRNEKGDHREKNSRKQAGRPEHGYIPDYWRDWPTQPALCTGNDGLSPELAGITFSKWRNESIKSLGNAIVPQVAYEIFKVIQQFHNSAHNK